MSILNYQNNPHSITIETIETERQTLDILCAKASEAAQAYLNDAEARKSRLEAQAKKYADELTSLERKETATAEKIAALVAAGEAEAASEAEAGLDKLYDRISALRKKAALISGATVKGDSALYDAAKVAMTTADAAAEAYRKILEELLEASEHEVERLERVAGELRGTLGFGWGRPDFAASAHRDFVRVDRHFRNLDEIEVKAKAAQEAEGAAKNAAAQRVVHVVQF